MKHTCLLATALAFASAPFRLRRTAAGRLQGSWRITRVLPTTNNACWGKEQAEPLLGSVLTYREDSLRWRGGSVPLDDITTRTVTDEVFRRENSGSATPASFAQLGIHLHSVTEVDLQHEDADITGASTEVPGDSVLLAGPNRIVVSACGVYFEATRAAGHDPHQPGALKQERRRLSSEMLEATSSKGARSYELEER